MITEISAALSSLKGVMDITKGLNAALTEANVNEVKIELQRALLDAIQALISAQEDQTAATARISALEQQIVQMKDWSGESKRYELHDIGRGAMAYVVKLGMEAGEPPHWLCIRCFGHGAKSIMQYKGNGTLNRNTNDRGSDKTFGCDTCKSAFQVSYTMSPKHDHERRVIAATAA